MAMGKSFENDPDFREWANRISTELVPMIERSAMTFSIVPTGPSDVKFAVELGLSLMMDKPIILLVRPGTRVPQKLIDVADEIVEADLAGDPEGSQERMSDAMSRITKKYNLG